MRTYWQLLAFYIHKHTLIYITYDTSSYSR